jgi:hypothetical protein
MVHLKIKYCVEAADRYEGTSLIARQKVRMSCRGLVATTRRADTELQFKNEASLHAYSTRKARVHSQRAWVAQAEGT